MLIAKMINRVRRYLAKSMDARPTLPTRHSHCAYPETQIAEDGSWAVRFYSYDPQDVPLIEMLTGKSRNRAAAAKDAYRALRGRVDHYRRQS